MSALHNVPLKWRLLIGGQVLITAGLMVHRMETLSSMNEDGRKVSAGEGRFAPPAVEQPDRARRKGGSSPTGGE